MNGWKPPENIQIPRQLFYDLVHIVCINNADEETWQRAKEGLEEKIAKLANRQRYSEARTAEPENREAAWQHYINGKKS